MALRIITFLLLLSVVRAESNFSLYTPPQQQDTKPALGGGRFLLEKGTIPSISIGEPQKGKPAIQLVYLFDWSCGTCLALHQQLTELDPEKLEQHYLIHLLPGYVTEEGKRLHQTMLTAYWADEVTYLTLTHEIYNGNLDHNELNNLAFKTIGSRLWVNHLRQKSNKVKYALSLAEMQLLHTEQLRANTTFPLLMSQQSIFQEGDSLQNFLMKAAEEQDTAEPEEEAPVLYQSAEQLKEANLTNNSTITFKSTSITTAPLQIGKKLTTTFEFTNTGTDPLTLYNIQSDCGCTKPENWKQTVKPQENGAISITYDSRGKSAKGPHIRTIWVKSSASNPDDPKRGTQLTITVPIKE